MDSNTRLHPLVSAAAISVIVLSAAGVGALTGILPKSTGSTQDATPGPVSPAAAATPAAPGAITLPVPATASAPAVRPRPAKKPADPVIRTSVPEPVRDFAQEDFTRDQPEPLAQAPVVDAQPRPAPVAQAPAVQPKCLDCGTVEAVREIEQKGEGSWIGPVAGGVGGAILGKQMGKGTGNTIMTILGAAGGAYAGHEIEKHVRSTKRWEVSVRLDDGSVRSLSYDAQPAWRAGERVRYLNGALIAAQPV